MITNKVRYGGILNIGDFIAISNDYYITYGWYCGNGKAGNIQYIMPHVINYSRVAYDERITKATPPLSSKDKKGFSLDHIGKSPVRQSKTDCVIKITNPEDIFSGRDLEFYNQAKETLTQIKFLK